MTSKASSLHPVVALVPAKDRADSIGRTVRALVASSRIDRIVVIDDGSADETSRVAVEAAGDDARVTVLRLGENRGKGGAVSAAIAASPEASTYLLIDADLGDTAGIADALLWPLERDEADLVIGVPVVAAGARGGFGRIKELARSGIRRSSGFESTAPLSGQRAVRAGLLRSLTLADRFGLETAMTIDAVRAGARVVEVAVDFDHRHTGRSIAGFAHRGRQGLDILRALWSRRTTPRLRIALMVFTSVAFLAVALLRSGGFEPSSVAAGRTAKKVVVFGFPRLSLDDLGSGNTPTLDRLVLEGAVAATSVRTLSGRPSTVESYASLGAGGRVRSADAAANAYGSDDAVGLLTAAEVAELRTGRQSEGAVVVTGLAETIARNEGRYRLRSVRRYASSAGPLRSSARPTPALSIATQMPLFSGPQPLRSLIWAAR